MIFRIPVVSNENHACARTGLRADQMRCVNE